MPKQTTITQLHIGLETQTENLDIAPEEVINFIKDYVDAGTFYEAKGLWKGSTENTIVFECADLQSNLKRVGEYESAGVLPVEYLKILLEEEFNQDSVMVKQFEAGVRF